jgi:hypothetical protein
MLIWMHVGAVRLLVCRATMRTYCLSSSESVVQMCRVAFVTANKDTPQQAPDQSYTTSVRFPKIRGGRFAGVHCAYNWFACMLGITCKSKRLITSLAANFLWFDGTRVVIRAQQQQQPMEVASNSSNTAVSASAAVPDSANAGGASGEATGESF